MREVPSMDSGILIQPRAAIHLSHLVPSVSVRSWPAYDRSALRRVLARMPVGGLGVKVNERSRTVSHINT